MTLHTSNCWAHVLMGLKSSDNMKSKLITFFYGAKPNKKNSTKDIDDSLGPCKSDPVPLNFRGSESLSNRLGSFDVQGTGHLRPEKLSDS